MFQVLQGMPEINPQVFLASTWEQGHFSFFPLFQIWIAASSKIFKQILVDSFLITKKDH